MRIDIANGAPIRSRSAVAKSKAEDHLANDWDKLMEFAERQDLTDDDAAFFIASDRPPPPTEAERLAREAQMAAHDAAHNAQIAATARFYAEQRAAAAAQNTGDYKTILGTVLNHPDRFIKTHVEESA